jgi:CRISPR type I-E-associated protein CasB/Cse2
MSTHWDALSNRENVKEACDEWLTGMLSKSDRGDLRRAANVEALYANESVHRLEQRLGGSKGNNDSDRFDRIAGLAALLASLEANSDSSMAARAGSKDANNQPKFSRARVGKLFAAPDINKRLRAFRELLRILGKSADAGDVAEYFLHWHEPKTRWHFARSYFNPVQSDESDTAAITA